MAISPRSGDLTLDDADLLVNAVNAVGVMGRGVALAFRHRWPGIMPPYQHACRSGGLTAGGCILLPLGDGRLWAALATKGHWRDPSRLEWIASGLATLALRARFVGVRSIAIPPIGCGLGGLVWRDVAPLVAATHGAFDLRLYNAPF